MTGSQKHLPWYVMPDGRSVADKCVWFDDDGARHGETPNVIMVADTGVNANLIAAAPELLAVALMIDAWGNGLRNMTPHETATVRAARSAIAKARGQ